MAAVNMPNVEGLNTVAELKNAIAKMTKELSWLLENIDWRNVNQLHIPLDGGAFITIENDGITVNDGIVDTFKVNVKGKMTSTGAEIQSSSGYPKVVMDPDGQLFGAYLAENKSVTMGPMTVGYSSPYVLWKLDNLVFYQLILSDTLSLFGNSNITISANSDKKLLLSAGTVSLLAINFIEVSSWGKLKSVQTGLTADQTFSKKGTETGLSAVLNCGIPLGTQFKDVNGTIHTWTGVTPHTHTQN